MCVVYSPLLGGNKESIHLLQLFIFLSWYFLCMYSFYLCEPPSHKFGWPWCLHGDFLGVVVFDGTAPEKTGPKDGTKFCAPRKMLQT